MPQTLGTIFPDDLKILDPRRYSGTGTAHSIVA
jgi:hypothetical protein